MCGISGVINLNNNCIPNLKKRLEVMNLLQKHRGPDGEGIWINKPSSIGLGHRRLSIIDLDQRSNQPMLKNNISLTFNGEIYNFLDLQKEYKKNYSFQTKSDTETIIAGYLEKEKNFIHDLRGMFSFALWDEKKEYLLCARDRFGIKPFYYSIVNGELYFASEAKSLLPFVEEIETDEEAFSEYLVFQYQIGKSTLFKNIYQLEPGHILEVRNGKVKISKYWDVKYEIDWNTSEEEFDELIKENVFDSLKYHLVSDVEIGSYVSGGIDSSLLLSMASEHMDYQMKGFHGRFSSPDGFDESFFASSVSKKTNSNLFISELNHLDFLENINNVIYHLDFPCAGPGSFPQYMVSKEASKHVKVLLGGQGGDEIFGGYARYIIAYLEQCLKAAIEGTSKNGNFVVTLESIIPNLEILKEYIPLLKNTWKKGLFDSMDVTYLRLLNKSTEFKDEINWETTDLSITYEKFKDIFNNNENVGKEAYFDKMTHFDFKTLLPALLQVEDRVSMAHGIESRVPFIDTNLIETLARVPADKKFPSGQMKYLLKKNFSEFIPEEIINRKDKMGFPVPLQHWFKNDLRDFIGDTFSDISNKNRKIFQKDTFKKMNYNEGSFSRKTWALLSLELWHQNFHDKSAYYKSLVK
tara:strand:+ start:1709 stop:3619 length:1911 start_codon:yes stop_codon:yes gene_type:complete